MKIEMREQHDPKKIIDVGTTVLSRDRTMTPTITPAQLDAIEAGARAAHDDWERAAAVENGWATWQIQSAFTDALSPPVALALVARIRELEAALDKAVGLTRRALLRWQGASTPREQPDVFWTDDDGTEHCIEEAALAQLLLDDIVFANGRRYLCIDSSAKDETVVLFVLCNDLFFWACADAEPLPHSEVATLYRMWKGEPNGTERWCCRRRKMRPQAPIERDWRAAGTWTDELESYPAREPKDCSMHAALEHGR